MKDDVFGVLKWTYHDCWEGVASFPHLGAYGTALDEEDPPLDHNDISPGATEPTKRQTEALAQLEALTGGLTGDEGRVMEAVLQGVRKRLATTAQPKEVAAEAQPDDPTKVELVVDTDGRREKPSASQRRAWQKLCSSGEALWEELLQKAVELYNRQRLMRVNIWERTYGRYGLLRCLPEVSSVGEMKRLVRPYLCRIQPPVGDGAVDIGIQFAATWHMDGFGAVVRDGQVREVGHPQLSHPPGASQRVIEHPVFGELTRSSVDDFKGNPSPWEGRVRCDPFLDYCLLAPTRAQFAHRDPNGERPRSAVAWEFAGGEFEVRLYSARDEQPVEAQSHAWAAFAADSLRHVAEMMAMVYQMYQEVRDVRRRIWKDRYPDDVIPLLTAPQGLRDLVQMRCIHIHPPDAQGQVTIAFQFVCSWDYDGLTALWRDGQVREWGVWKDAKPV